MPGYNRLRLPAEYQALTALDARGFAWEWLRRNPDFRDIWRSGNPSAPRARTGTQAVMRRSARRILNISKHPLAGRWSHWGLTFRVRSRHAGSRRAADRLESGS
ncbi:transcriptional regulator domain-containing protein [Stakelama pacifica]|uniref:Transcriptional regulator-like domain-containing protein n=1 Tax=Stakelama pacifica TaxID=517720 RepID=A0A4R6FPV0_9SPHN|nr:hypothetical protein EV664_10410 [Stakelama pacifica]GGO94080.1 hypothetical protein GCM10011329_15010 [Stakelama pacifica]